MEKRIVRQVVMTKKVNERTKGKIKLLPISNCWECYCRFEADFSSFCGRTEEPDKKKQYSGWTNKALDSREGEGIPNWCPLEDKRVRSKKVQRVRS